MTEFSIAPVIGQFDSFVVGVVIADGIGAKSENHTRPSLDKVLEDERRAVAERLKDLELGDVPALRCWRQAYKAFGVRGTSFRSSVERLVRLALRDDRPWSHISPLVDAYNIVSLRHLLPVGADDLAIVTSPLGFRVARDGDRFVPLGSSTGASESPEPGEIVYADANRVLCRRWNWYQSAETAVSNETSRAMLTIQALGPGGWNAVDAAMRDLDELLSAVCASRQTGVILDATSPTYVFESL